MYWKCLLTLTKLSQLVAIISIFSQVGWFHASSLTLLISIVILGNVLSFTYKSTLSKYCKVDTTTVDVANVAVHVVIPLIIAVVLIRKHGNKSDIMSWKHAGFSAGAVIGLGILYFLLTKGDLVSSYGVSERTQVEFLVAWVILALLITPLSLSVFNKKK